MIFYQLEEPVGNTINKLYILILTSQDTNRLDRVTFTKRLRSIFSATEACETRTESIEIEIGQITFLRKKSLDLINVEFFF